MAHTEQPTRFHPQNASPMTDDAFKKAGFSVRTLSNWHGYRNVPAERRSFILGLGATALTLAGVAWGWNDLETPERPKMKPFDPATLTQRVVHEAIYDNISPEAPAFPSFPGMNLLSNLSAQTTYLERTGATAMGWSVHYNDGQQSQTVGVTKDKETQGEVIEDTFGERFLHVKLRPTMQPILLQFYQTVSGKDSGSIPAPFRIPTAYYETLDTHETRRIFHDGNLEQRELLELHEFIKTFDFLFPPGMAPNICIRQGLEGLSSTFKAQEPQQTADIGETSIDFDETAFKNMMDNNMWQEIVAFHVGRYLLQQIRTSAIDSAENEAYVEFVRRMTDPTLVAELASSNKTMKESEYDYTYPSVYEHLFPPSSYLSYLSGLADFSLCPENVFAGFVYKSWQDARPKKTYTTSPPTLTGRYRSLQEAVEETNNVRRIIHDPTLSDRAAASHVSKPIMDVLTMRSHDAPEDYVETLDQIRNDMQLDAEDPFVTYPSIPPFSTIIAPISFHPTDISRES